MDGVTLNVLPGMETPGDSPPPTIFINGAANNDVINLGPGNDVVELGEGETVNGGAGSPTIYMNFNDDTVNGGSGSPTIYMSYIGETVNGGTGNAQIEVGSDILAGVTVDGGTGKSTLTIAGGGDTTIGDNISNMATIVLAAFDANATLSANSIAGLVVQDDNTYDDTLRAGGPNQTLTGGAAGKLTFIGATDTIFQDPAAALDGDSIQNFLSGDLIDLTDLGYAAPGSGAGQTSLSFTENAAGTAGSLAVMIGGVKKSLITLSGSFDVSRFSVSSDGSGGTYIGYQA
jgi:hypothetical protein